MIDEPFNSKPVGATDDSYCVGPEGGDPGVQVVPTAKQPFEPPYIETLHLRPGLSPDVNSEWPGENPKDSRLDLERGGRIHVAGT